MKLKQSVLIFMGLLLAGPMAFGQLPTTGGQQSTSSESYTDAELKKFIKVSQTVQEVQGSFRQKMMKMIQESELDMSTFQEMSRQQSATSPDKEGQKQNYTESEKAAFEKLQKNMAAEQQKIQKKMETAVRDQGMEPKEYQEMARNIKKDQKLLKKVQGMMRAGQNGAQGMQ